MLVMLYVCTYKHFTDKIRREASAAIQGCKVIEKKKDSNENSDMDDFAPCTKVLRTPGKRKSSIISLDHEEGSDFSSTSHEICEMLTNISAQKRFKKIKINLKLVQSD